MKADCEVLVIGGGPAGMMAAARAAERGRRVILLEKNTRLGKKLSITGGGRCNVTNNKPVVRQMLSQYKESGKFLFSTFMQHGVAESIQWFTDRQVELIEENEGRLFPATQQAETICATLVEELQKQRVEVRLGSVVTGVAYNAKAKLFEVATTTGALTAAACVLATGGTSRPETGSTGEGFGWLQALGHTVVANDMALVPVKIAASWLPKVSGVTLPAVKLSVFADGVRQTVKRGKLLFTHVGVTGPTVLNLSREIGQLSTESAVTLVVDLLPDSDAGTLKIQLQELFALHSNKKIKNVLSELVPTALGGVLLALVDLDGETPCHSVKKEERAKLALLLKALPLSVAGLLGADKAVVSAGGVQLEEVNFKTMESRVVPQLYLVGDVLNINRPSGGYSLQLCWTTGYVAGSYA